MGHANGPHRGGAHPARVARRGLLTSYVRQHLTAYRGDWFTAVELARVIRDNYLCEPAPPSHGRHHYGRSNVLLKILTELEERGDVERRNVPWHNRPGKTRRQWRAAS